MAFRNYFPHRSVVPSSEITEKTLQNVVNDDGLELVNVVETPIPDELPDYRTTSLDALKSAGVIPEKVSHMLWLRLSLCLNQVKNLNNHLNL